MSSEAAGSLRFKVDHKLAESGVQSVVGSWTEIYPFTYHSISTIS